MPRRLLPASIRSLKARLNVLKRPSVWGSASLLLVALFTLAEHWNQPDRFTGLSNEPSSEGASVPASPLSPLDPFSSVDDPPADNSDEATLTSEFPDYPSAQSESFTEMNGLDAQSQLDALDNALDTLVLGSIAVPSAAPNQSSFSFPTAPPAEVTPSNRSWSRMLMQSEPLSANANGRSPTRLPPSEAGDPINQISPSPLQSALDRQSTTATATAEAPIAHSTPPGTTPELQPGDETNRISTPLGLPRSYSPQPLPGQPSNQQTFPQPVYLPQTSPAPGTTGYTLPSALVPSTLRTPTAGAIEPYGGAFTPPSQIPSFSGFQPQPATLPSTIQPTFSGTTVQPQFSQPNPAPFSIPRTPPGRAIGGGQINTFSNP
jgi:hypothetical protein